MDVLKQLEAKLRALVEQRNRLQQELEAATRGRDAERGDLEDLRRRLEASEAERKALAAEREQTRKDVEQILKLLKGVG
ncbi:MAG: hypothetical protein HY823_02030 [Acidobacteria bacterium]|nr:hypothetical protein [Acidobacteriota bacterium]